LVHGVVGREIHRIKKALADLFRDGKRLVLMQMGGGFVVRPVMLGHT
jgi:hypothetical protein